MKKFLAIMLALMLALSAVNVAWAEEEEESDWVEFDASLTNYVNDEVGAGVDDWFESSYTRAALTILLMLDLKSAFIESTDPVLRVLGENWLEAFENPTYVGSLSLSLFVPFRFNDCTVSVSYCPLLGTATYMISDTTMSDLAIELVLSESCDGNYYENTTYALLEALSDLQSDD